MSCERSREELKELAAGGPAAAGLESHIAACAECRRELLALREALALADAALAGLAIAEPAPEFRARLRQRVDEARGEAAGDRLAWRWPWLATAVAICAAVFVAVLWRGGAVARRQVVSVDAPAPVTTTTTQPARAVDLERASPSGPSKPSAAGAAVRPAEPQVLVPAGEQRALVQFIALVHEQKATPPALLAAGEPSPNLVEPRDIRIEPLEIAPLDPAEAQGME